MKPVLQRNHQRIRPLPLSYEHPQKLSLENCRVTMQPSQHPFLVELGRHLHEIHSISKFSLRQTLTHNPEQSEVSG
jgi:hypothetical protein